MRFQDKVLFATGGGSGIGAAVAQRFAEEGGRVVVADLDAGRSRSVADRLEGALALTLDVSDEDSVRAAAQVVQDTFGGVDAVLNAGGHAEFGPFEDWSVERWDRMMAVHATGTFLVCKHMLPLLRARGGGSIVNIASVAALVAQRGNAPYGAAKAAVVGFTRQIALEVAPEVRVNAVAAGRVRTGMTEPLITARGGGDAAAGAAAFGHANMQRRTADPEELAASICFLLSEDASFVTGSVLVADGGETAQ
jgi:NAD(P)-dependent dehydrogenase (short-subunit alcohol dehydrogenase family)